METKIKKISEFSEERYILYSSLIAICIAIFDIGIIYWMSIGLQNGLGLAAIGIGTFFGMLIVSSYYEEHRHPHQQPIKEENSIFIGKEIENEIKEKIDKAVPSGSQI